MRKMAVTVDGQTFEVELDSFSPCRSTLTVQVNGETVHVLIPNLEGGLEGASWLVVDDRPYELLFDRDLRWVKDFSGTRPVQIRELNSGKTRSTLLSGRVKAPIPGQIAQVLVSVGQAVEAGQLLLVLEAMKMYNEIHTERSGTVQAVHVTAGENVGRGDILVEIG